MAPTNQKVSLHVPEDVVFSIFSKLPLKSVNRFTCVSKSWTTLFENSYFMNMFSKYMVSKYHLSYDEACLLLNCQWRKLYLLSGERFENKVQLNWPDPFNRSYSYTYIFGSAINGTLCINNENHSRIVLWNPATDESNIVPANKVRWYYGFVPNYTIHGFGYDHVRDDYKIIQYVDYTGCFIDYCQEKLYVDMRKSYILSFIGIDAYLNGVCHWWGETECETYVVSFNLSNEVPVTTLLPSDLHDLKWVYRYLAVLNEHVAMISNYAKTTSSLYTSISILGEPGVKESWIKLFDIGPLSCMEHPIGVGKKGNIFIRKDDDNELACLDLTTGVMENIGAKAGAFRSQIVLYDKNILPIKGMNN
ncbi:F-box protein interaction domain protein [Medicago truncatula]|uniref:F-box protein interaction domain protein n=1 Tax=Medicago truncatula TaxID=3880 RepID=G7IT89_MEDTR|nr:F-box protein interaction domain protein [Medicago truncatula]